MISRWQADKKSESWNAARSSLLQVAVSILGLVLVKHPYFNEAGYDVLAGSADSKHRSEAYSERTYFRSREFIAHAMRHGVGAMNDIVDWLYRSEEPGAPQLLDKALEAVQDVVNRNGEGLNGIGGLQRVGKGAVIKFRKELEVLKSLKRTKEEEAAGVEKLPHQ
jgi:ubiquitin-conjugating enzyme E2 O